MHHKKKVHGKNAAATPSVQKHHDPFSVRGFLKALGPGLVTGASDELTGYEIDVFRDTDVDIDTEDVDLEEFADEIESHVIEKLKSIGCDTAKSVLELNDAELARRTGLEEDVIASARAVLASEFED